jgi:hypothetical protein
MSYFTRLNSFSAKLAVFAGLLATAACASQPAAPPAVAPSVANAPTEGAGVAEQQAPPGDDFVFVAKERKEAPARDDVAPATSLHVDETARKQRIAH